MNSQSKKAKFFSTKPDLKKNIENPNASLKDESVSSVHKSYKW